MKTIPSVDGMPRKEPETRVEEIRKRYQKGLDNGVHLTELFFEVADYAEKLEEALRFYGNAQYPNSVGLTDDWLNRMKDDRGQRAKSALEESNDGKTD